ncbi:DUF3251 domain-containing protein [Chlorobium phaeovibrioides]|uniref:DUF3251 domain-containing protein n=1 Tax=Chlorobium phaeovibrioides TaxID=1094 RepID=A0A3S0L4M0_CHLPH|nr:DUF3251 domain-containing protein [Chlorobium phaeovibrioides]MWV55308.1 DUF3251 domain-containing protein [Chlorobium phaeovibrioides]RTY34972.1 DUF3251 domain-containing protein [Chlorobium phaeovibrioides]
MYRLLYIAAVFGALLLAGCDQSSKVKTLETKVASLEKELADLKQTIELNQFNQMLSGFDKVAYLTPGSDGYSLVKSDLGVLTVSIANIAPYANGSKVTLQFGNLSAATIDGLKAKLEWGAVDKNGMPNNENAKSRDVSFNESLISGSWTNSNVVLEGVPPQELGFVRLRDINHRGIKLRR